MAKILLVDDDAGILLTVKKALESEKYAVDAAPSGSEALDYLKAFEYDLLILDWQLPEMTGIEICKFYRGKHSGPVLFLTGMSSIEQKVEGFEAGADDYLTKPFHLLELLFRVKALLRRPEKMISEENLTLGDICIDLSAKVVKRGETKIELSPREFEVLEFFIKHPNEIISPDTLLKRVWSSDSEASPHAVYSCLNRLRKNLDPKNKEALIRTVHGYGYKLEV